VIAAGEQAADAAPESPVTAEPVRPRNGRSFDVAVPRIAAITTEGEITPVADLPGSDAPAEAGVNGTRAHRVPDPLAQRLRARVAEQQEIAELDAYRAKHGGEASYQAKHAAERVDDDHHAVVRTVSRLVAVKAVAIATAAAIGVAAAAAATTGIVANVVVPAINESVGKPVTTVPTTAAHHPDSSGATTGSGAHRSTATGEATGSDCTTMSLLPTCVPLPPILVVTVPPDVAAEVTAATGSTPGTTTPDTTPSTTVPDTSTTSETTPETTPTTEVEPPPSTDPPPPETTVPPTDPGQSVNPFSGP
jgi:hypothetical protein